MDNGLTIKFCEVCGLPLITLLDGSTTCRRKHKPKLPKRGRFSGATKRMKGAYERF
jgi:hypothetical protein